MIRRLLLGLAALLITGAANAAVTYSYTGNTFLYIGGCCGVSHVSGSFTVAGALAANSTYANLAGTITNYAFTDGRTTFNSGNDSGGNLFTIETDALGNISEWQIDINSAFGSINTHSYYYASIDPIPGPPNDNGLLDHVNVFNDYNAYSFCCGNPNGQNGIEGVWAMSGVGVPEPKTYALLLAGLGLLGFAARRAKLDKAALA